MGLKIALYIEGTRFDDMYVSMRSYDDIAGCDDGDVCLGKEA